MIILESHSLSFFTLKKASSSRAKSDIFLSAWQVGEPLGHLACSTHLTWRQKKLVTVEPCY